jgi:hypothetical protein
VGNSTSIKQYENNGADNQRNNGGDPSIAHGVIAKMDSADMRNTFGSTSIFTLWLVAFATSTSALACQPSSPSSAFFPACSIPAANLDEELIVVTVEDKPLQTSSVALGDPKNIETGVVDLDVMRGHKPLFVVLSSRHPVIWRFNGDTDAVARVIALGSMNNGADIVGVAGIPKDRVVFTEPDKDIYAQGAMLLGMPQPSMCDWVSKACNPDNYFFRYPSSAFNRSAVLKPKIKMTGTNIGVIEPLAQAPGFKPAPAGTVPPAYFDQPRRVDLKSNDPESPVKIRNLLPDQMHKVILLRPEDVVAPRPVQSYAILPGDAGIRQLIDKGVLHPKGAPRFQAAYDRWNETRSAPYRSRFDTKFLFNEPYITHLLTESVEYLPANGFARILLEDGVAIPKHAENRGHAFCFYYVSGKTAGTEDCNPTLRLSDASVSGANGDNVDIQKARLDDIRWMERAIAEELERVRSSTTSRLEVEDVVTPRRKFLKASSVSCRIVNLEGDVHTAALTIHAGRTEPNVPGSPPQIVSRSDSRLDVEVRHPGKVFLYLNSEVGAEWHVKAGPDTAVVGILLRDTQRGSIVEKPKGAEIRSIWDLWSYPRPNGMDCGAYWPPAAGQLGGPAPLLIDRALTAMTGKGLDQYIARQMPRDLRSNENEQDWARRTDIKDFTTFVVE